MLRLLLPCGVLLMLWQGTQQLTVSTASGAAVGLFETENARAIMRRAKSAEMRNYMQTNAKPCDDFYAFACGNWEKINPATATNAKTGIFNVLTKAYKRKVARLLREPKTTAESDMERKVKYFFESCLNREEVRHNYREKLLSVMEEFGGMPALKPADTWQAEHFDWLDTVALILRKYGKQIIIGVDIAADLSNNEVNRLYVGQLDELVTKDATYYYWALKIAHQGELQKLFGLSAERAAETANEMVDFQLKLAEGMSDPHEGLGMEDKTRLRMLDEMSESYKPTLNYSRFVQTWLGNEYRLPVYEYVEMYQRNLRKLIEETPPHVIANYIMWQLVQDFRLEAEESDTKQLTKCIDAAKRYFVKFLDNMVYRQLLRQNRDLIADVEQVWTLLKQSFERTLKSNSTSSWMSEGTRDKALEKLSAMTLEVNSYAHEDFDKEFGDLVISTDHYFDNVINILELRGRNYRLKLHEPPKLEESDTLSFTPAYAAEYNRVFIPVAFLQPHYFWNDLVYPAALKFSTVGYIIAHELAHGFDDTNRKYDAKGNLNNWWDRNSTLAFGVRKDCLRQQYSEYKYGGHQLPKSGAQGENIADNVGVRIAFAAYESWLALQPQALAHEKLPQMDFTPRQLFFIGVAQVWCADVSSQWKDIVITTDVHAPEEVRVPAMLANFDAFAAEFKCTVGEKMHPHRKCVFY